MIVHLTASALLVANLFDCWATLLLLKTGKFHEANPVMGWCLSQGITTFVWAKLTATLVSVFILWVISRVDERAFHGMLFLLAVYVPLTLIHIVNIITHLESVL